MANWWDRNKDRYPVDWGEISRRHKDRTGWTCEGCGVPHGPVPYMLTVHHLNHEPADCDDENLLVCCQRCHLLLQGMRPEPRVRDYAIRRLRRLAELRASQLTFFDAV